ncbi:MAG: ATP-binding protein [Bacteroidota bacterium]
MTNEEKATIPSLSFTSLFQHLPEAAILKDEGLRWLDYNEAFTHLLGVSQEQKHVILHDHQFFSEEVAHRIQEADLRVLQKAGNAPQVILVPSAQDASQLLQIKRKRIEAEGNVYLLSTIHPLEVEEESRQVYQVLDMVRHYLAQASDGSFLDKISRGLAQTLGVDFALICLLDEEKKRLSSRTFWVKDHYGQYDYDIVGTPCEKVVGNEETLCVVSNVAKLYPEDQDLTTLAIESYLGVPLFDSKANVLGHLVIMDTKPLKQISLATTVMQIYSSLIAVELERSFKEEALQQSEARNQAMLEAQIKTLDEKNQQLQHYINSNSQLENFAYVASHDLKEPLRTIGNFSQLIKRRYQDRLDQDGQEFLDFIISGVADMSSLIEGVLEYAKVNKQSQSAEKEDLNPAPLIQSVIDSLQQVIQETGAQIQVDQMPSRIHANPLQLKQIFLNLLNNAIKFRKPDAAPRIQVRFQENATHWQFCVIDNGQGIKLDYHETIFRLFTKLHSRHDHQGSGIGLAICREISLRHGGSIWLESEENKGAKFHFTIAK